MDKETFIDAVMWRAAMGDRAEAQAAIAATLSALAAHLAPADVANVAEALPRSLADVLRAPRSTVAGPGALHAQLAASEGVSVGLAVERVSAVCETLAAALDPERRVLLQHRLPSEWATLVTLAPLTVSQELPHGTIPGHGHTLATGRPGSANPLAEGRAPPAQSASVVRSDNPHEESKLSSARTSARAASLATGRPGAEQPIADAKDERKDR